MNHLANIQRSVILIFLLIIVIIFLIPNRKKNSIKNFWKEANTTIATVKFLDPISSPYDFLFTTAQGQMMIMLPVETAQMANDSLKDEDVTLNNFGIGNAFLLKKDTNWFLCTATHLAIGMEGHMDSIGQDIALIDYESLHKRIVTIDLATVGGYPYTFDVEQKDSLFIRGYISDNDGKIKSVLVSGLAIKQKRNDMPEEDTLHFRAYNMEYMQDNVLAMRMKEYVDLSGLSGSPAFNKNGQVVGIFSGITMYVRKEDDIIDTTFYIRVSLFSNKKE